MPKRKRIKPAALLQHYTGISRLLGGHLDFQSAIRAVAVEIAEIVPHDHLDVCVIMLDGKYHTAYESGIDTDWGVNTPALVSRSPIRSLLWGEEDHILTGDASIDPRFHFRGALDKPIFEKSLRSRLHVPMKVKGEVIGALSCSCHKPGVYTIEDVVNAQAIADLFFAPYFFALRAAQQAQRSAIVEAEARAREEGLRQGALNLTEALERERQRIGMDLHDQTLADLTRLARQLERFAERQNLDGRSLELLARSLQNSMHELRQIIEETTPSVLRLFGFAQAVENHLDRSIRDCGAPMAAQLRDESGGVIDRLDHTVRIALFRIVQEAINNAVRHSRCSLVSVNLDGGTDAISVAVSDDGRGMPDSARRHGGGMQNMATRARLISAELETGPGDRARGTTVRVSIPLSSLRGTRERTGPDGGFVEMEVQSG